ncbi:MAG: hypothetical protein E7294_00965 [Lachnospiraceae bacterium]|nr:hypothetical protein [Lachnospiraceae bacterium]
MGKIKKTAGMVIILLMLTACAKEAPVDTNTVSVEKDGTVKTTLIEDFTQSYYNADELKKMIDEEVAAYNKEAGADKVTVATFEPTKDKVRLELDFADSDDYAKFNSREFFVGTAAQAQALGIEIPDLTDAQTGATISSGKLLENSSCKMVVTDEAQDVRIPGKILYYSEGLALKDKKTVTVPKEQEKAFIVYE